MTASSTSLGRLPSRLRRAAEIVRDEGASSLWFKALARLGYRRAMLFARSVDGPRATVKTGIPVTIRRLGDTDIADYLAFRPEVAESSVHARLEAGHYCFAAHAEGRIVHADWVFTGRVRIDYLDRDLDLASDECYPTDSYTLRSFRGLNVAAARSAHMIEYMRQRGYRRALSVVLPGNRPAYRAIVKAGYHTIATIGYLKLGPWRRDFYRPHDADRP